MRGIERVAAAATLLIALASAGPAIGVEIDGAAKEFSRNSIFVTLKAQPYPFPRDAYGAYEFKISNQSSGSFNNARFRATLLTEGATFVANGTPVEPERATCTFITPSSVDCVIGNGSIPAAGETTFNLQVKTPAVGTKIEMNWNVRSGQGAENFLFDSSTTALSDESATGPDAKIATAVPPGDYYLVSTGLGNNLPSRGDHASAVGVSPRSGTLIIASLFEGTGISGTFTGACVDPSLAGLVNRRYCTNLSVETGDGAKAQFDPFNSVNSTLAEKLTIVFRFAAEEVGGKSGININQVRIWYVPDGEDGRYLNSCNSKSADFVPVEGNDPCIFSRTVLSKKFGDLAGIGEIVVFAKKNGRFGIE